MFVPSWLPSTKDNSWSSAMVLRPLLEGERMQRRYRAGYKAYAAEQRKGPIDFSVVPELKTIVAKARETFPFSELIVNQSRVDEYFDMLELHLQDALDGNLPIEVRNEHFDIAGSYIWMAVQLFPVSDHLANWICKYIAIFTEANGV